MVMREVLTSRLFVRRGNTTHHSLGDNVDSLCVLAMTLAKQQAVVFYVLLDVATWLFE